MMIKEFWRNIKNHITPKVIKTTPYLFGSEQHTVHFRTTQHVLKIKLNTHIQHITLMANELI